MAQYASILPELVEVIDRAGDIIRENDAKPRTITLKGRKNDLVTETDLAVELFLKERLAKLVPEADFLAEETAKEAGLDGLKWIIDPVDGTTNFAHGLPLVATSVALARDGVPILGVVNLPLMREMFAAAKGEGARMNGRPISVSTRKTVRESLLAIGFPYAIETFLDEVLAQFRAALPNSRGMRRLGAAALDLAYVACGRMDGFFEIDLSPWDTAAGMLLVQEAGGTATRFDGISEHFPGAPDILAANGHVTAELADMLVRISREVSSGRFPIEG